MSHKVLLEKGYTLQVESWENDGDHYATREMNFKDKDKALLVKDLCDILFTTFEQQQYGSSITIAVIQYLTEEFVTAYDLPPLSELKDKVIENYTYLMIENGEVPEDVWEDWLGDYIEENSECELISKYENFIMDKFHSDLVGSSECGNNRIVSGVELLYTPEDITAQYV